MENKEKKRSSRLKNRDTKNYKIKTFISSIILFIIAIIIAYMGYGIYKESKVRTFTSDNNGEDLVLEENIQNTTEYTPKKVEVPIIPVPKKYLGYEVSCRLEIPKIDLNTNVLANYSTEGLKVCASKYYGPDANEVGNYCIAGHNYQQKNMFNNLIDLDIGDTVLLTDNENGIVEYVVYDIYKVKPQNTEPLSQNTQGKKEITLITCVNYSRNRLVVKALEREKHD